MATNIGQKLSGHLKEVRQSFLQKMNEKFSNDRVIGMCFHQCLLTCYKNMLPSMFVDMSDKAICFEGNAEQPFITLGNALYPSGLPAVTMDEWLRES